MTDLFLYGSLVFPEAWGALTGEQLSVSPAVLEGYHRYAIKDFRDQWHCPAIAPQPGAHVEGVVVHGVDDATIALIDAFEAREYERRQVTVVCAGRELQAGTYVWKEEFHDRLYGTWDKEIFRTQHLAEYVASVIPRFLKT